MFDRQDRENLDRWIEREQPEDICEVCGDDAHGGDCDTDDPTDEEA
jgi:hypothetical protein